MFKPIYDVFSHISLFSERVFVEDVLATVIVLRELVGDATIHAITYFSVYVVVQLRISPT